jgi:NADPH2:quinone reductase
MQGVGGPEVLQPAEVEKPKLAGEHEMLVRVMAAGVNPIDTKLRSRGLYLHPGLPAILGCDGAGVVEAVGEGVTRFAPGDAIYYCYGGLGQPSGNYAEYTIVDEAYAALKPAGLSFLDAAAAPLVLITAWEALFDRAVMREGSRAFIHAGAGGVGHVAIQLAKLAGAAVATSVSSDEKAAFVSELGADHVIRYRDVDVAEALLEWTDGAGVDVAFDTVGGPAFMQLVPAMAHYGDLVSILQVPEDTDFKALRMKNVRVSQELMLTPMLYDLKNEAAHQGTILEQCAQFFDENQLSIYVSDVLPLEEAAEAHRRIEAGHTTGKFVLDISGENE